MSIKEEDKQKIFSYFDEMNISEIKKLVDEYQKYKGYTRPYNSRARVKQTIASYKYYTVRPKDIIQKTADKYNITYKAVEKIYYSKKKKIKQIEYTLYLPYFYPTLKIPINAYFMSF